MTCGRESLNNFSLITLNTTLFINLNGIICKRVIASLSSSGSICALHGAYLSSRLDVVTSAVLYTVHWHAQAKIVLLEVKLVSKKPGLCPDQPFSSVGVLKAMFLASRSLKDSMA